MLKEIEAFFTFTNPPSERDVKLIRASINYCIDKIDSKPIEQPLPAPEEVSDFPDKEGYWLRLNAGHRLEIHNIFKIPNRGGLFIVWGFGGEQNNVSIEEIRYKLEGFNWIYIEDYYQSLKTQSNGNTMWEW